MTNIVMFPHLPVVMRSEDNDTLADVILKSCIGRFDQVLVIGLAHDGDHEAVAGLYGEDAHERADYMLDQVRMAVKTGEFDPGWHEVGEDDE